MDESVLLNYQAIFTKFSDAAVMIDLNDQSVVWVSRKFSSSYPQIKIGSSCRQISRLVGEEPNAIDEIAKKLCSYHTSDATVYSVLCNDSTVEICGVGDSIVAMRLRANQKKHLAQTRYLEDREKLLFTSRSITVSEMASTLAHEINQPVGTISNLLYGIKSRLSGVENIDSNIFNAIDKSLEQTKYTSDIISRIRDYTHSRKPKLTVVVINKLIDKCISLMDWEIRNRTVEIAHHQNRHNAIIRGDELMLQQVIVNLIRNGMDANLESDNAGSKISITTSVNNGYVEISIIDNGKGLTDQEAENLFIPFASNKSTGMGIGLNICRSFIELHQGKLWLTRNETQGCTSHIMLPLNSPGT